ncbi:MAG: hypothetical protein LBP95_03985, partial [Deltaproteobacteria bacterium]|nr:hypothetical protein [Deltaproteobacteria bacterium]
MTDGITDGILDFEVAYRFTYFVLRAEPIFSIKPDLSIDAITASTVEGLMSGRIWETSRLLIGSRL